MKIVHATSVHPAYDTRIFEKECKTLSSAGYRVTLLSYGDEDRVYENSTIVIKQFKRPNSSRIRRFLFDTKNMYKKMLEEDADLYHIHDPEMLKYAKKLTKAGYKVIYDAHEDLPKQVFTKHWIPKPLRGLTSTLVKKYLNKQIPQISGLVAATDEIRDSLCLNNSKIPSAVCTNYAKIDEFNEINTDDIDYRMKQGFCYIGTIEWTRGVLNDIEVSKKTGVPFYLGGYSRAEQKQQISNKAIGTKTEYLGFLNREQCRMVMDKSLIGIITLLPQKNYLESVPNKMFEYMAMGLPIVASNFPYWNKFIKDNNCGIMVDPENINDIVNAVNSLNNNRELAEKMGKNGRKAFLEKYNWESEAVKLIDLYKKILN